ncbi:glycosyltransferase, partial [Marinomonas sp.]
ERLLAILEELEKRDIDYDIAILGEQFRSIPIEFDTIKSRFSHRIRQFGFVPSRSEYLSVLASSDMVISTALHEFQGLAVLEAVALGGFPILPNRQVYPELFYDDYLYRSDLKNRQREASSAVNLICRQAKEQALTPLVHQYGLDVLLPKYDAIIKSFKK